MKFVYNQWDYGYRDQPIPSKADFGGRGNKFGLGAGYSSDAALKDEFSHYNRFGAVDAGGSSADSSDVEIMAANDMIRSLQSQILTLQSSASPATGQISALQSELAKYKSVANQGIMQTIQANLPYIALGVGGLMMIMMLRRSA